MIKPRHFTIPVFIPEEACPNRCVFCNQHRIAGADCAPSVEEVIEKVNNHLTTIPENSEVEIGFFGGNFTGIPMREQQMYLQAVQPYLDSGRVQSIRISTRPDYINTSNLDFLKTHHVKTIELGAQSLDNEVLQLAGRGHNAQQVVEASEMIREHGFSLGLQMMTGLPGDTVEKSLFTAREIIRLGADCTRIYPTLVIKNTELEQQYLRGEYKPLSLNEAIERVALLVPLFVEAGVRILRIGLHPSEGLLDRSSLVAGPFEVAFGEMVYSEIWRKQFENIEFPNKRRNQLTVSVPRGMRNPATGYKAMNKAMFLENFRKVVFVENDELKAFGFHVDTD